MDPSNSAPENIFEAFNLPLGCVEEGSFKDQPFFYQFSDDSYDEERLMITMAEKYEHKVIAEGAVIITAIMIKMIIIAILPMKRGSGVEVQSSGSSLAAI